MRIWVDANYPPVMAIPIRFIGAFIFKRSGLIASPNRVEARPECADPRARQGTPAQGRGMFRKPVRRSLRPRTGALRYYLLWLIAIVVAPSRAGEAKASPSGLIEAVAAQQPPRIKPDYRGIVVPPNICPLNFEIQEPGGSFFVRLHG